MSKTGKKMANFLPALATNVNKQTPQEKGINCWATAALLQPQLCENVDVIKNRIQNDKQMGLAAGLKRLFSQKSHKKGIFTAMAILWCHNLSKKVFSMVVKYLISVKVQIIPIKC